MASIVSHRSREGDTRAGECTGGRRGGRRALVWLLVPVLLLGVLIVAIYARSQGAAATTKGVPLPGVPTQPADRFIQSIVVDDGALGWRQLCPSLQARLPVDALVQQADAERASMVQQGVRLSARFTGSHPAAGGILRTYVLTARWPNGATQQRTFAVLTQASGCVADIQSQ